MKKVKALLIVAAFAVGMAAVPAFAYGPYKEDPGLNVGPPVTVHVDGSYVATDVPAYIKNGRTFLPMRAAAEAVDANVSWDQQKRCVTVEKNGTYAYFFIGSKTYYADNQTKYALAAPEIKNGRTMLPIRDFGEAVHMRVEWDAYNVNVDIYTGGPIQAAPTLPYDMPEGVKWFVKKYYVKPTEPGIGSWYYKNSEYNYGTGRYEDIYDLIFVSKMKDGMKTINTTFHSIGDSYFCFSEGRDFREVAQTYILQDLTQRWCSNFIHGHVVSDVKNGHFVYEGNNLRLIGYDQHTMLGGVEFCPTNEVYQLL